MQVQILAQTPDDVREKRANTITAIVGGAFAFLGLEIIGVPAFTLATACGLGVAGVKALKEYRKYRTMCQSLASSLEEHGHNAQSYDEEKDRYYRAKVKKLDDMQTVWGKRATQFTQSSIEQRLKASGETSYTALIAIARRTYTELDPPFQTVRDFADDVVLVYMRKNNLLTSPLPSHWEKYREALGETYTYGLSVDDQGNDQGEKWNDQDNDSDHDQDAHGNDQAKSTDDQDIKDHDQSKKRNTQTFDAEMLEALRTANGILGRDKLKVAYAIYPEWKTAIGNDEKVLTDRGGLEFVRSRLATTKAGAESIQRIWKLRAVKEGFLSKNPRYTGKPPHPEFLKVA